MIRIIKVKRQGRNFENLKLKEYDGELDQNVKAIKIKKRNGQEEIINRKQFDKIYEHKSNDFYTRRG